MAPPNRPLPRELRVTAVSNVTPNMLRITLGGPGMDSFPSGQAGGYVKLNLPSPANADKKLVRTYTIRAQREGEIDVDFALHGKTGTGSAGPATEWAVNAQVGDTVLVGGPGPAKPLPADMPFYLVVGDMTALPANSVNLEQLDENARGIAVFEIMSEDDRQDIGHPKGVEIRWIVNPQPGTNADAMAQAVRDAGSQSDDIYAWSASEFATMQALRAYFRDERGLGPDRLYISSYWKSGLNEEGHKQAKREDAMSQ